MIEKEQSKVTLFHKFTFTMLGISSLIGWNAVCNSFPFYDSKYDDLDNHQTSDFYFPIPLMFANFMWGPFMPYFSSKFSLFQRISFGLIVLSIVMLLLPLIAQLLPHSGVGFGLCLACTYLIGSFNSIAQNSMIGMVSAIGGELISIYWVATGISGLSMNVSQAIAMGIFGTNVTSHPNSLFYGTIFYYSIAVIISISTIFMFRSVLFESILMDQSGQPLKKIQQNDKSTYSDGGDEYTNLQEDNKDLQFAKEEQSAFKKTIFTLIQGLKIARSVPVFIWLIYVQTFCMFPGVMLKKYGQWLDDKFLSVWGILLLITTYNVGDIVGKQITAFKNSFNYNSACIVLALRFGFFFFYLLIAADQGGSVILSTPFAFINSFIFAVTNGYCTAAFMTIGPGLTDDPKKKEVIGFINGFALTFGISIGTFMAIIFQHCDKWNW